MKKQTYQTPASRVFGFAAQAMLAASKLTPDGSQNIDITVGDDEWDGEFQSNRRYDSNFWND